MLQLGISFDNLFTLPLSQDYHCQEEAPEKQKSHVGAPKGHYEPPVSLIYYLKLFDLYGESQLKRKAEIQCVIVNLQPEKISPIQCSFLLDNLSHESKHNCCGRITYNVGVKVFKQTSRTQKGVP